VVEPQEPEDLFSPSLLTLLRQRGLVRSGPVVYGTVMSVRFEMRLDDDLLRRIETARGAVPRAAWIKLAIEEALGNDSAKAARESVKRASEVVYRCPVDGCRSEMPRPGFKCKPHDRELVVA
jgi:metal-responsive CopG/Arc/MetJ family transcriptional regulator